MIHPDRFAAAPRPWLEPFVHSYWGITRDLSRDGGFTVTPDRFPEVIFFTDPPFVKDGLRRQRLPASVFIGLLSQPLRLEFSGTIRCASIRLHAWSAGMILRDAGENPACDWFAAPPVLASLLPRVQAALKKSAWREIPPLLDAALAAAFSSPPSAAEIEAARAFARQTADAGPGTRRIAEKLGYSRRQVERQVRTVTGVSPKQLSSLARFQFERDAIWAKPDLPLASLAIDAGYADQAHLTREFRKYAGQTPSGFRRHCMRLKQAMNATDVAFIQDQKRKNRQSGRHED